MNMVKASRSDCPAGEGSWYPASRRLAQCKTLTVVSIPAEQLRNPSGQHHRGYEGFEPVEHESQLRWQVLSLLTMSLWSQSFDTVRATTALPVHSHWSPRALVR